MLRASADGQHINAGLFHENGIIGHSFILNIKEKHPVFGIGIVKEFHGRGLGRELMNRVIREADSIGVEEITLTVVKLNAQALRLYGEFGFRIIRDHTFRIKNDSYFMIRTTDVE